MPKISPLLHRLPHSPWPRKTPRRAPATSLARGPSTTSTRRVPRRTRHCAQRCPAGRRKSIPTYNRQRKRCSQSAAAPRADPSPAIRARSNARRGGRKARLTAHARTGTHAAPSARKTSRARTFRLASEGPRHPQHSPPATGSDASKWAPPDTAASRGMSAPQHRIQPQSRSRRGAAGTHWRPPKRPPRAVGPMLAFAPHGLCAPGDAGMPQVPPARLSRLGLP